MSFYDTAEGVRRQAALVPGIGKFIARYDVPEGIGITWEQTLDPGHYDLRGDREALKRCLSDEIVPI